MTGRVFNVFAFRRGDEASEVLRRNIPEWRLEEAVRWAFRDGRESVLIDAHDGEPSSTRLVTHHVCCDPHCPGGCD